MNREQAIARAFLNVLRVQLDDDEHKAARRLSCQTPIMQWHCGSDAAARLCVQAWPEPNCLDILKRG